MDKLREECGVFGVFSDKTEDLARSCYYGLYALQHRGQESCGIVVNDDGVFSSHKDLGLVSEVFSADILARLPKGTMAVGHARYGTTGGTNRNNCQPIEVNHQKVIAFIDEIVADCGKPKHEYVSFAVPEDLNEAMKAVVSPEEMEEAVFTDDKQTREENIKVITAKLEEAFADNEEWLAKLPDAIYQYQKKTVRKMILKDNKRPDGRAITQIRPLAAEIDLLPRVHGSAMFTRGQTQICTVTTLAPLSEAQ